MMMADPKNPQPGQTPTSQMPETGGNKGGEKTEKDTKDSKETTTKDTKDTKEKRGEAAASTNGAKKKGNGPPEGGTTNPSANGGNDALLQEILANQRRLEDGNKALVETNATLQRQVAELSKREDPGSRLRQISGERSSTPQEQIDAFLSTPGRRGVYYTLGAAAGRGGSRVWMILVHGSKQHNERGEVIGQTPPVESNTAKYEGPGSELRDPNDPRKPLIRWGVIDLNPLAARHAVELAPKGSEGLSEEARAAAALDVLVEAIESTQAYADGEVLDEETAKDWLRNYYESAESQRKLREKIAAQREAGPRGAFKAGRF
jgi:hypothetical protein